MIRSHKDHSIKEKRDAERSSIFIELETTRSSQRWIEVARIHRPLIDRRSTDVLLNSLPRPHRFAYYIFPFHTIRLAPPISQQCFMVKVWNQVIRLHETTDGGRLDEQGKGQIWYNFDMRIFFFSVSTLFVLLFAASHHNVFFFCARHRANSNDETFSNKFSDLWGRRRKEDQA